MKQAFPIILSSPSGAGKTTIVHHLLKLRDDIDYSVSCTTRAPRNGEVDGRDYYFLSVPEFLDRRQRLVRRSDVEALRDELVPVEVDAGKIAA